MTSELHDTGGPAFPPPVIFYASSGGQLEVVDTGDRGMTLRDYFAGQALIGLTGSLKYSDVQVAGGVQPIIDNAAALAYGFADALLLCRAKKGGAS